MSRPLLATLEGCPGDCGCAGVAPRRTSDRALGFLGDVPLPTRAGGSDVGPGTGILPIPVWKTSAPFVPTGKSGEFTNDPRLAMPSAYSASASWKQYIRPDVKVLEDIASTQHNPNAPLNPYIRGFNKVEVVNLEVTPNKSGINVLRDIHTLRPVVEYVPAPTPSSLLGKLALPLGVAALAYLATKG